MASQYGGASRGKRAMSFTTGAHFASLNAVVNPRSDESGESGSLSSSFGSMSQTGHAMGGGHVAMPPRGLVPGDSPLQPQYHSTHSTPTQQMPRMAFDSNNMPSGHATSAQRRMSTIVDYSGSPHKVTTPGLNTTNQVSGSAQGAAMGYPRGSNVDQASPTSRRGSGMAASFNSSPRAPTMMYNPNAASLHGIPQLLAVQEMAYRQGQHDHGVTRDRLPSSPFARQFDQVWTQFYFLGQACGGTPIPPSNVDLYSGHPNFLWPILINPYTQDLEHPNGIVDVVYARKICTIALDCMAALIRTVCKRQGEWRKTICDVPAQVKDALMNFEDLHTRYELLKQDAREAINGGLPTGY